MNNNTLYILSLVFTCIYVSSQRAFHVNVIPCLVPGCHCAFSDSTAVAALRVSILSRETMVFLLSIIIMYFYTYNLLKLFNPRKVPLLSSEILLFSRFLREMNRKNREILIFVFYIICFVNFSVCGCLSGISLVFEYLQVCQRAKALKSS